MRAVVAVAEPRSVLRDGLAQTLTGHGHEVAAAVADAVALRRAVAEHRPDVAVIDTRLPPGGTDGGLRAALELRRDHPRTAVLVFAPRWEEHHVPSLLAEEAGGTGYLLQDRIEDGAQFLDALTRVARGETALDPEAVTAALHAQEAADGLAALSPRELEVLALMARGRTNTAIARELVISHGTVEKRVAGIFTKLGLPRSDFSNRRVLAVLRYLRGRAASAMLSAVTSAEEAPGAMVSVA
ncbi:LuxR C-terminal-related transcriptional regulator [Streptomyces sp. URMC 123]|uniref:LuxR C-terminal-related transcriptional regulator n=1 Tax=Streptomyces sp. URMC 123 TaxID=3423403 RepID=UPI003F197D23